MTTLGNPKPIIIKNKSELLSHPNRDTLTSIIYEGTEMLNEGDLPSGLIEVQFVLEELISISGKSIPSTVESVHFPYSETKFTTPLSELPVSVHTVKCVNISGGSIIPPNIKSIIFNNCPNISNEKGIKIPSTVQECLFDSNWSNEGIPLKQGDLPESLTKLTVHGFHKLKFAKGSNGKNVFPNSVKHFTVTVENSNDIFPYLPNRVELLSIHWFNFGISKSSLGSLFKGDKSISPNSIPSTVTEIYLLGYPGKLEKNTIPSSVTSLNIFFTDPSKSTVSKGSIPSNVTKLDINKIIDQPDIIPSSLTYLSIGESRNQGLENIKKMIPLLPPTLTTIVLPRKVTAFNLTLPSNITNVEYTGFEKLVLKEITPLS